VKAPSHAGEGVAQQRGVRHVAAQHVAAVWYGRRVAGRKMIDDAYAAAGRVRRPAQMRADEARSAGDQPKAGAVHPAACRRHRALPAGHLLPGFRHGA